MKPRRVILRIVCVSAAATLGAWFASRWSAVSVSRMAVPPGGQASWTIISVLRGQVQLQRLTGLDADPADLGWRVSDEAMTPDGRRWAWGFERESYVGYSAAAVPLWAPFALLAGSGALLRARGSKTNNGAERARRRCEKT